MSDHLPSFGTGEIVFGAESSFGLQRTGEDTALQGLDGHQVDERAGAHCVTRRDTGRAEFVQPFLRKDKGGFYSCLQLCNLVGEDKVPLFGGI